MVVAVNHPVPAKSTPFGNQQKSSVMTKSQKSFSKLNRYICAGLVLAVLAVPAVAASLKSIMGSMGDNTTSAKAVLANFDGKAAEQVLRRYAADAEAADAMFTNPGSAKEKDLHARFSKMAMIANTASQQAQDKASFRKAFAAVATECKSCHATYK
ncbi:MULTISPECIES: cytochrome c [Rhizobium]|nr:cytochrome c [Rhizobium lusitanum]NTJ09430.1 cytochrome c [Rhizobium lusitanum]